MPTPTTLAYPHLAPATLSSYLEERLSPEDQLAVEEHLETCDSCLENLDELLARKDPQVDHLVALAAATPPAAPSTTDALDEFWETYATPERNEVALLLNAPVDAHSSFVTKAAAATSGWIGSSLSPVREAFFSMSRTRRVAVATAAVALLGGAVVLGRHYHS